MPGGRVTDLTGRVFGKRTVRSRAGDTLSGASTWHVECQCGHESQVLGSLLLYSRGAPCPGCPSVVPIVAKPASVAMPAPAPRPSVETEKLPADPIGLRFNTMDIIARSPDPECWTMRCFSCGWLCDKPADDIGPATVCIPCRKAVLARRRAAR